MSALDHLHATRPGWFVLDSANAIRLLGRAQLPQTPWVDPGVALEIRGRRVPYAGEQSPGTVFPARCPERHIQGDQSFCLGLDRPALECNEDGSLWWEELRQYLICQSVAHKTGCWPAGHALDHGNAGQYHARALIIAKSLDLEEDYLAAYLGEPSWITDPTLKLLGRRGEPINGRSPCPRGCRSKKGRGRVLLRAECPNRSAVLDLIRAEAERRRELARYWDEVRAAGTTCCGSMLNCELRSPSAPQPVPTTSAR